MKLIVSSDGETVVNADRVSLLYISDHAYKYTSLPTEYRIYADGTMLAKYNSVDEAKKTLKSITTSLTSSLSDVILYLEDGQ